MPELLKLLWGMIVLRGAARKHQLTASVWVLGSASC